MIFKYWILIVVGAGLLACSTVNTLTVEAEQIPITEEYSSTNRIDSIVAPYKSKMDAAMDSIIAFASNDFTKGRPSGSLNNWSADAVLIHKLNLKKKNEPVFCLLNVGGLRNPLSKGPITIGDIFKLMPFDNEVVWVEMPNSTLLEIETYLIKSGGEPISGASLVNGKLKFDGADQDASTYWIITSDYLMNGGDKMSFFEERISEEYAGILLRDLMLDVAKKQDTLVWNNQNRITF
jgi:2',3'-cyclic-nucleotide 2'-phosphodiesterase (5'-nucleotidase family)